MFVLSDSNANRAYGTSRGFQWRACKAARSADACSSVSLQVWMVSGFTQKKLTAKERKEHKEFAKHPEDVSREGREGCEGISPFVFFARHSSSESFSVHFSRVWCISWS